MVTASLKCQDCGHEFTMEVLNPVMNRDADAVCTYEGYMGSDRDWCPKCENGVPEVLSMECDDVSHVPVRDEPTMRGVRVLHDHIRELRAVIGRYQEGDAGIRRFESDVKKLLKKSEEMIASRA